MMLDFASLLDGPVSDGGCINCGRPLHDDDARVFNSPSRFDIAALVCTNCASGKVADDLVLFPE